jgi:hypothetical protein
VRALDPVRRSGAFVFCAADHDALVHLLVPADRADEALDLLRQLAW